MPKQLVKISKVKLEDVSISYYIKKASENEDKVVIFIHGFPFNKNTWKPQLDALSDNITAIAIDVRGHGLSTSGHGFFSIDTFAKDLQLFITKLELTNVVLCGVSMGGYIALRYYELYANNLIGLILSDTHHLADDNQGKKKRFDSIQAILTHGKRAFAFGFIENLLSPKTITKNVKTVELIKSSIRRNSIDSICATQLALAARTDSSHVLPQIKVPCLLIRGEEDKITPRELMTQMHKGTAGSIYIEIPQTGHLPNLENPTAFNQEMNNFLEKL